ncbi:Protein of unknown function [Pyronema omphalodes CBS 100304]|uniref:Uncharacterized protein n=1 Tax=Pyronema omphalodes (strain CBS 100304) TaxID=1076935 RepID=U4KZB2_PYROM|nr:Protein of unknown function [Pyronema omphalodes CBS 100304]
MYCNIRHLSVILIRSFRNSFSSSGYTFPSS